MEETKVALASVKDNFFKLVDFVKEKVDLTHDVEIPRNEVFSVPEILSEKAANEMARREMLVQILKSLLGLGATVGLTYYCVNYMVNAMDPTKKEKQKSRERAEAMLRRLGVIDIKLSDYELCIAANLVDPSAMNVSWEDIGGLKEEIDQIQDTVIFPFRRSDLFKRSSLVQPPKGVLLYGPPGCGKTMIAKATAKAADSFLRSRSGNDHEATLMIKTQFMSFWDGLITDPKCQVMIMGASNRPHDIDAAILRRMPCTFRIGMPARAQRVSILSLLLEGEEVDEDIDYGSLGDLTDGFSGSDIKEACRLAALNRIHSYVAEARRLHGEEYCDMITGEMRNISLSDLTYGVKKIRNSKQTMSSSVSNIQLD
ncbi:ATAD1-like protein [Mya arenaria]|uniref:ATAD1-like protein n=1 Tax=Mya arenaria TaxID=6604 RepID=A0ABY7DJY6_MYAAR|nr:ATAD1-like protein [Mya arenaria]